MRSDVKLSIPMKSRKRALEDDISDSLSATKHRRFQPEHSLPTPSPTTSPKHDPRSPRSKARKQHSRASPQSEPKPPKRAFEDRDCDRAPSSKRRRQRSSELQRTWFLKNWLQNTCQSRLVQEKAEGSEIIPTIEGPSSPQILVLDSHAASDQISQQDGETLTLGSAASVQSERLNTSSPMYRATLKMNGVFIDNFGTKIPRDVQELVTKHIRKERKSPRLGEDEKAKIIQQIEKIWDKAEPMVSDIITTPLFPLDASGIAEGRDIFWSTKPMSRSSDYPYTLPAPKTDRHFGFPSSLDSGWTREELATADHSKVRPYSQPTRENLFPSFLIEVKSEATHGTLYTAEGQIAGSGAHRVSSLIWMLDLVDPSRSRSSADALVFSAAVSQREAVAHVHYYNPNDDKYYMSYIDTFPFAKDAQGCHDHIKNVVEWLLEIQQPIIRDVLTKLHPITKLWKKARSASAIIDAAESFTSEDGRPTKSQRT